MFAGSASAQKIKHPDPGSKKQKPDATQHRGHHEAAEPRKKVDPGSLSHARRLG